MGRGIGPECVRNHNRMRTPQYKARPPVPHQIRAKSRSLLTMKTPVKRPTARNGLAAIERAVMRKAIVGVSCLAAPVACPAITLISSGGSLLNLSVKIMNDYHTENPNSRTFGMIFSDAMRKPASEGLSKAIANTVGDKLQNALPMGKGAIAEIAKTTISAVIEGASSFLLSFTIGG